MGEPPAVTEAMHSVRLGERFGKLPTEILEADPRNLGLVEIANLMDNPPKAGKEADRGKQ